MIHRHVAVDETAFAQIRDNSRQIRDQILAPLIVHPHKPAQPSSPFCSNLPKQSVIRRTERSPGGVSHTTYLQDRSSLRWSVRFLLPLSPSALTPRAVP